ncbi:MAG: BREX-1 system phosphatase PglZ type B [Candidatus Viridilinea halotolerans]|uniref:BREX-1 system phosphatase PglZ type B n=1 Tax=Candidatus Viridilinea halotolerans TaxID=2491704 RepID=A0A426TXR3_9CHLR|nr:MAG: BREX-1 system phosphatase PglZ type B [Candidatus Viridilinea halotolerans]
MTQPNQTLLDALVAVLKRASAYNRNDQLAPAAVLWPDQDRLWTPLIERLRDLLPLLTFGPYLPAQRSGPAYWLRCMLARTLDDQLPAGATPIIYLPGVSKADLRAVEECPRPLQPLAELQYRGVIWTHRNGREWTPAGFLQAADGAAVEVVGDGMTRDALQRALPRLVDEPLTRLRSAAPLRADFFDALLTPDTPRSLLLWLDNPERFRQQSDANAWAAFVTLVQRGYDLNPERDGQLSAAMRLGGRQGAWEQVWTRFAEAPDGYPNLPELLRRAKPGQLALFDSQETWPQDNEAEEQKLRERLFALGTLHLADGRAELGQLEREHAPRRAWVWARLGQSPLVGALAALHELVTYTSLALHGSTLAAIVEGYTDCGWRADAAALQALACVEHAGDVAAVSTALRALYQPWLEQGARAFQAACAAESYPVALSLPSSPLVGEAIAPGVCLLFCDALRYDLAQRFVSALQQQGVSVALSAELAPFPGITPTAKTAVAPVATSFTGSGASELTPLLAERQRTASAEVLRGELERAGFQILSGAATGDPSGRAWCELGAIDSYGHQHGIRLAQHVSGELRALEWRIAELLQAGWQQVVVITDHGWLLLPGELPKVELPATLTVVRKERCARLQPLVQSDQQTLPWFWDATVSIATPPGIACYEAGHTYAHGGLSAQECVIPRVQVTRSGGSTVRIARIDWRGLRCTVVVEGSALPLTVDLRSHAADASTSLVANPRALGSNGSAALLVEDEDRMGASVLVVVLAEDGSLLSQRGTTVGGA